MTFEEAKDIIAKEKNFKNWNEATRIDYDFLFDNYEEAAELYANSLAEKAYDEGYKQQDESKNPYKK